MKKAIILSLLCVSFVSISWDFNDDTKNVKCLIQLTNYGGEGAYIAVSLLDEQDQYVETLYLGGFEEEWYPDLPEWYAFYDDDWESIDGITGASIQSGGRKITSLQIDADKLDAGYKIRFETSVEDEKYYPDDVVVDLSNSNINNSFEGKGYIRQVRLISK